MSTLTETGQPPTLLAQVTGSEAEDGADLPREELLRRYRNQQRWFRAYAECLDGIPEITCMSGSGIDGCRMPDEVRRIVTTLVAHCQTTWEHGYMGRAKRPNDNLSHGSATWPHVMAFACVMEAKLARNRHKGDRDGWLALGMTTLRKMLTNELDELEQALALGDANAVAEEAADVANFAMMIADKFAKHYQEPPSAATAHETTT